jgi:flagellin-like hook-associated protein FlgL
VGANPNQVINIGLKDFSYNLGVPAVASESKFSLAQYNANATGEGSDTDYADATDFDPTGKQYFRFTIDSQNIDFTLTRAVAGSTMTEEELVDFETEMNRALTDTDGFSNVVVTRVGSDIYVRDAEGRSIGDLKAYSTSGRTTISSTALETTVSAGVEEVVGIEPESTAVFSGSARLNDTQIKTQTGANQAIARLDNAMANVDHELATFGSVMNRLTFAGDNLTNVSQNTQQSRSRVLDTDYAAATTELARTQIIQQAGMAMLAQANQQPQTVLSLLQ